MGIFIICLGQESTRCVYSELPILSQRSRHTEALR